MTDVSSLTAASQTSALTQASIGSGSSTQGTNLTSDFETFLKLLTTQAENQDPLEPLDSTEYASQLAQFSMVEQQVQSNDTLSALTNQLSLQNANALASWVGMQVRAEAPAYFDGTNPVTLIAEPDRGADKAHLVVTDAKGYEVQRLALDFRDENGEILEDPIQWTGLDSSGDPLPSGLYSFAVESFSAGETINTSKSEVYTRVVEAQFNGAQVSLVTLGGATVDTGQVRAIRE